MQRTCRITVLGLSVTRDFEAARGRLLADFPDVHEVVPTRDPATLLVLYSGPAEVDAWIGALLDSIAHRRAKATRSLPSWPDWSRGGDDSAA